MHASDTASQSPAVTERQPKRMTAADAAISTGWHAAQHPVQTGHCIDGWCEQMHCVVIVGVQR